MTNQERLDKIDSGMSENERGTPYTMGEVEAFVNMEADKENCYAYPCDLMRFMTRRIERLEREAKERK